MQPVSENYSPNRVAMYRPSRESVFQMRIKILRPLETPLSNSLPFQPRNIHGKLVAQLTVPSMRFFRADNVVHKILSLSPPCRWPDDTGIQLEVFHLVFSGSLREYAPIHPPREYPVVPGSKRWVGNMVRRVYILAEKISQRR